MRIEWLNKKGESRVILFFNGWGVDQAVVSHLTTTGYDLLMLNDYRSLDIQESPDLSCYAEIYVVAWSMGVWAASNILGRLSVRPVACIALNGTERPIDDFYGIPEKIYNLTVNSMDERGKEKFIRRMFAKLEEFELFSGIKSDRDIRELCEELILIQQQSLCCMEKFIWNKVYVSDSDRIVPPQNQLNWWQNKVQIISLNSGHAPFFCFKHWKEIIGGTEITENINKCIG